MLDVCSVAMELERVRSLRRGVSAFPRARRLADDGSARQSVGRLFDSGSVITDEEFEER